MQEGQVRALRQVFGLTNPLIWILAQLEERMPYRHGAQVRALQFPRRIREAVFRTVNGGWRRRVKNGAPDGVGRVWTRTGESGNGSEEIKYLVYSYVFENEDVTYSIIGIIKMLLHGGPEKEVVNITFFK